MDATWLKVVVERHPDGYVAYPLGLNGVVVGQGDTDDDALGDVTSAIRCQIETFGGDAIVPSNEKTAGQLLNDALGGESR